MSRLTRLASGLRAGTPTPGSPQAGPIRGRGAGLGNSIDPVRPGGLAATISTRYTTPGQPVYQDFDATIATRQGYLGHAYVMRCVRLRAETVAGLPFVAGLDMGQPDVQNGAAALSTFLGQATTTAPGGPNPQQTARSFWIWSIVQRIVTGRMAWELDTSMPKGKGAIMGLYPLVSAALDCLPSQPGSDHWFDGYSYNTPLGARALNVDEVMYDWRMSAEDPRQAESVLQSCFLPISIAVALDKYMWSILSKGMMASKMVIAPPFEDAADERAWEDQFFAEFSGFDNAGKTVFAYADDGDDGSGAAGAKQVPSVQVIDLGMKATDAQLYQLAAQAKIDIEIALGVPESLIGNASERVFANADSEYRNFWTTTIINDISELQEAVNLRLAPRLGREVGWFDLSQVAALQPPMLFTPPDIDKMLADGVLTVPDVVKILNLGALESPSEDVATAPIGEELAEGSSVMQRSAALWNRRSRTSAYDTYGYRAVHHGSRLAPGVFAKRLPLNTRTLRDGVWQVEQKRERIVTSGHRAEVPALAIEVTQMANERRRLRTGARSAERIAELEAKVAELEMIEGARSDAELDALADDLLSLIQ